ncbi:MAG: ATP-binding protein [Elusimicrobiota bacterium]
MDKQKHYQSIRRSIIGIVAFVSLTPLLIMMGVTAYEFHTAYRSKVLAYLVQVVEKHADDIDTFLDERLADIRVLAGLHSFQRLSDERFLSELLRTLQEQHGGVFVDVGLVNREGRQVAYAGPFKLGKADYANAEWFKEVAGRRYHVSDVFLGLRGLPHFIVAVKPDAQGKPGGDWVLRATIDFVAFNRLVENLRLGNTGLAFIINREGRFQTRPRIDLTSYVNVLQDFIWKDAPAGDGQPPAQPKGAPSHPADHPEPARRVGIFTGTNPEYGRAAIYVTTRLKNGGWALVYQQDKSDAYASLYRARNISMAVALLAGIAVLLIASILSKRFVGQIAEGDRAKELMNEKIIEAGKLASIGELAAGIAHEINNPVAIAVEESGWIGDLLEESEFGDTENVREIRRALEQIKKQGKRCKQITQKLLSFARKTDPVQVKIQLNDLVREVRDLSGQRAKYEKIKFKMDLARDLPPITISPSEISQVLLNLINNAIDAIDHKKGGTVTISTRTENGDVALKIADTGQGIPEANLKRIFDPFFTTKPVGKGTGLGLSICHGIVAKMGGKITVDSAVGVGTTFHIRLPREGKIPGAGPEPA